MNCKTLVAAFLLGLSMTSASQAFPAEDALLKAATERTRDALANDADPHAFVVHLRNALRYATGAFHHRLTGKDKEAHEHLRLARPSLKEAIADARAHKLETARNHAKEALEHLEAAEKGEALEHPAAAGK
jgi:hypothetical protein